MMHGFVADSLVPAELRSACAAGPLRLLQLSRNELNELDCHPAVSAAMPSTSLLTSTGVLSPPAHVPRRGGLSCLQVRRCGISSRLVAAAYLHASGHSADLCSQMASPPLWAQLSSAQPRLCMAAAAQPATPMLAARAAPLTPSLTDMSDDGDASPPFASLVDVTPVHLHACTPFAEVRPYSQCLAAFGVYGVCAAMVS